MTGKLLPWDDWTEDALLRELSQCDLTMDVCKRVHDLLPYLDLDTVRHSYLYFAGQKSGIRHYSFDALGFVDEVRRTDMTFFLRPGACRVAQISR